MPSTHDSNNSINMDLEEALAAASPPPSSNRNPPGNNHARTTTFEQPGNAPEAAAATATAPAAFSAPNNDPYPELVDDASGLSLPMGMLEAMGPDAAAFHHSAASEGPAPPSGVEIMDGNDGPPLPMGMYEWEDHNEGKKRGAVELIEDGAGPDPPFTLANHDEGKKKGTVEVIEDDAEPEDPFAPATYALEENADEKRKAIIPSDVDSIIVPPSEENEDLHVLTTPVDSNNRLADENTADTGGANNAVADLDLEQNNEFESETQIITEAYPVEERSDNGMVIHVHAQPLLPWWKQKKPRLFLAAVFFLIVILTVSLGVPLSLKAPDATPAAAIVLIASNAPSESPTEKPSDAPSTTSSPSYDHSDSPSASLVPTALPSSTPSFTPSYSPSACVDQISSNSKKIDLSIEEPYRPEVAVDGKDMVVVAQQGDEHGPVFVIFYALANGEWQKVNTFREDGLGSHSDVVLSGTTAFVGFNKADDRKKIGYSPAYPGAVSFYGKDQYGDWGLIEDPFIHDANATYDGFGLYVDIDGDLACVGDYDGVYLYRRESSKWVQFNTIIGGNGCSIAGHTIATRGWNSELGYHLQLYSSNQKLNRVFPIQDPIPTHTSHSLGPGHTSFELSHEYLVYWDKDEKDAFIYHQEESNQTYTFLQQSNISGPFGNEVALDNDILVVGDYDETHIFSKQNYGKWEESITLDQSYDEYALSGRRLIATLWSDGVYEAHYFDIEVCSQEMPTQTPSLSMAPSHLPSSTMIPSSSPTTAPSSSSSPSISTSPTTVPSSSSSPTTTRYCIQVAIDYDYYSEETRWEASWKLYRVVGDGGENVFVKSHQSSRGNTSHVESLCLQEAEYIFTIYDNIAWKDEGGPFYNVTANGMLIAEGGDFKESESTAFSLPFAPSF